VMRFARFLRLCRVVGCLRCGALSGAQTRVSVPHLLRVSCVLSGRWRVPFVSTRPAGADNREPTTRRSAVNDNARSADNAAKPQ
jgi:hypothetical protein